MNILFNDKIQYSDAPRELKSPSLSDTYNGNTINVTFTNPVTIDCVGIGNTDSYEIHIKLKTIFGAEYQEQIDYDVNGLYLLSRQYENIKYLEITLSGSYIGRLAVGKAVNLKTSIPKEPTLCSTNSPRVTLSGNVIEGLGGYNYWRVSLDTRYKIDNDKMREIIQGFPFLSKGYPFFVDFEDEKDRLPFIEKMYCIDTNQQELSFESSINKTLFSRRWVLEEKF
jgi:hypothetical protein